MLIKLLTEARKGRENSSAKRDSLFRPEDGYLQLVIIIIIRQRQTLSARVNRIFSNDICRVQALSVIDNVLVVTAFPLYFLPTFVDYTGLYTDYVQLNTFHQCVLVYVLPVAFVAQTATIWVTVLVAVNRYIAVCRPYQVRVSVRERSQVK